MSRSFGFECEVGVPKGNTIGAHHVRLFEGEPAASMENMNTRIAVGCGVMEAHLSSTTSLKNVILSWRRSRSNLACSSDTDPYLAARSLSAHESCTGEQRQEDKTSHLLVHDQQGSRQVVHHHLPKLRMYGCLYGDSG
jgi:hypothetical protein